jgi:hypothetical protein
MFDIDEPILFNEEKEKRNRRFQQKQRHINRQVNLKKQYNLHSETMESHRYHKVKSLNCGDPNCAMCGNPRKFWNDVTIQEKKFHEMVDDEINEVDV